MELKQFTRIALPVNAVEVTLNDIEEIAKWCGGTIEQKSTRMMGTSVNLPVIKLQGQGDNRGKVFEASLGCWIVELRGSFRAFKPTQFESSFQAVEIWVGQSFEPEKDNAPAPTDAELIAIAEDTVASLQPETFTLNKVDPISWEDYKASPQGI